MEIATLCLVGTDSALVEFDVTESKWNHVDIWI